MDKKKFYTYSLLLFAVFIAVISLTGFFKIGILSDTFGDAYTAVNSTFSDKISNNLQYIDEYRYRPVLFLALKGIVNIHKISGLRYDNFLFYNLVSLILYILFAFVAGIILFGISGNMKLALLAEIIILIYPNNLHNLFWSAAFFEILCGIFYLFSLLYTLIYLRNKKPVYIFISVFSLAISLLTKETAVTFPFICLLLVYMIYGKQTIINNGKIFVSQFLTLIVYFISKTFLSRGIPVVSEKYFADNFFINSVQIILKGLIAVFIPYDFSYLKMELDEYNLLIIIYVVFVAVFAVFIIIGLFRQKQVKRIFLLFFIFLISISPFIYAGYIRPQLILLPFTISLISTTGVIKIRSKIILYSLIFMMEIWLFLGYGVLDGWKTASGEGKFRMNSITNTEFNPANKIVIIGNPARFQQFFMYDNIMFPYNYFKYHSFIVKDTISDLVRTTALDKTSLNAEILVSKRGDREYELMCTGRTQSFFLDGSPAEIKINNGIKNDLLTAEVLEYNRTGKPISILMKILKENTDCYIFIGSNLLKLN
jgi:hypothetical protein